VRKVWNLLTQLSSMVRNGSPSRTQLLPTRPRQCRSDCGGTFRHLSAPRIGPRGVQTSTPWTYKLWAVSEDTARQKRHNNLDSLKRTLAKAAAEIPPETARAMIAEWPERLEACVKAQGSHFEWHYYRQTLKTIANKLFGSISGCSVSFSF